jgi:hypothetical protein
MRRPLVDVVGRAHFDQLAQVHDADPVGQVLDDHEVVRDDDVGQAVVGLHCHLATHALSPTPNAGPTIEPRPTPDVLGHGLPPGSRPVAGSEEP